MPLTSGVFNRGLFRLIGVAVVPLSLHAYHYSSLICSAQCARGWILMPWRMIVPRVAWTHTPTQIGSRSWSSTQRWSAHTHTHTWATPCFAKWDAGTASPPPRRREGFWRDAGTDGRTHFSTSFADTLSQRQKGGRGEKRERIVFKWNQ